MNYRVLFRRGKGVFDFTTGSEKEGVIKFEKKTWNVQDSKPSMIRVPKIDSSYMPVFMGLFLYMTIISSLYSLLYAGMMALIAVVFTAFIPKIKGTKPFYVLGVESSLPLEPEDELELEMEQIGEDGEKKKSKAYLFIEKLVKRFNPGFDGEELKREIKIKQLVFRALLDPSSLFALLSRETMKDTVRKPRAKFDMFLYIMIGGAIGALAMYAIMNEMAGGAAMFVGS